jgi:putative membrane protein
MKILIHLVVSAAAVYVSARLLPGVWVDGFGNALVVAVVLGLINALVRPILFILTLPINLMTLGLFTFVIMGLCVELTAKLVPGFHVTGFLWAMAFATVLAVVNSFLHAFEKR